MNLFELTRTLIDIPSVSGEELEVGRFIASHLEGLGYRVELQEVEPGRANVVSKGSLRLRLTTRGRAAHSAYPERGESAIEKMLDVLAALRALAWPRDEFFGETTCNIGTVRGGTRPNVVAAEAQAELQIRLVTPAAEVKKLLEEAVAGRARVEYLSTAEPV